MFPPRNVKRGARLRAGLRLLRLLLCALAFEALRRIGRKA
jgi:hypothetical protein